MAPELEQKSKMVELRLLRLNLADGKPFDVKAFDEAMFWVNGLPLEDKESSNFTQFVITDDIMYVFPPTSNDYAILDLDKLNDWHPEIKLQGLQAYGTIDLSDFGNGRVSRIIGYCPNMPETGWHSRETSSQYMHSRFVELIGDGKDSHTFMIMA